MWGLIAVKLYIYSFLTLAGLHFHLALTWLRVLPDFLISVNDSIILPITPFILRLSSRNIIHINSLNLHKDYKAGLPRNYILQLRILSQGKLECGYFKYRARILNHYVMLPQKHSTPLDAKYCISFLFLPWFQEPVFKL